MDPDAFTSTLFKWDPRSLLPAAPPMSRPPLLDYTVAPPPVSAVLAHPVVRAPPREQLQLGGLEELFHAYGVRYYTAAKVAELGFTASTLVNMKEEELEEMMNSLSHIFRWDLLVGERYGIKAAVRAERRRRIDEHQDFIRRRNDTTTNAAIDALSQEGVSEERVGQQKKEAVGSTWDVVVAAGDGRMMRNKQQKVIRRGRRTRMKTSHHHHQNEDNDPDGDGEEEEEEEEDEELEGNNDDDGGGGGERQREHPFIVTEPGEVARGKKNGLDYLFHLYDQCREFLIQVQNIAKDRGDKCPTKVTNEVFRYAKKAGARYINKPKMRHYVHCYALHCLDEEVSNELRRAFKERGENVGAWRLACYKPLVAIAALQDWDIDAIFNAHPRLSIWYVPTKLRQLCHAHRNNNTAAAPPPPPPSTSFSVPLPTTHLPF